MRKKRRIGGLYECESEHRLEVRNCIERSSPPCPCASTSGGSPGLRLTGSLGRWVRCAGHCHPENVGSELVGGFHASLLSALFTSPAAHSLLSRPRPLQSPFVPTSIVKSSSKSFSQAVHPSISSVRRVSALILHCSRDCFPPLFHSQCAFKSLSDASDGSTEPQRRETAAPPPVSSLSLQTAVIRRIVRARLKLCERMSSRDLDRPRHPFLNLADDPRFRPRMPQVRRPLDAPLCR